MISNEQAVIAAILLDERNMRTAISIVVPVDFDDMRLGEIYRGMTRMVADQEPINVITVAAKLSAWNVRGISPVDLHAWISDLPHSGVTTGAAEAVRLESMRRGIREVSARMQQGSESHDLGNVIASAQKGLHDLVEQHTVRKLHAKTLGEILAGTDDYDWVIPDLLERGDRVLITGAEGGGKSTLVRQMAIASAAGVHPFTFERMKAVKVLVIDAENSEKQWRRASRSLVELAQQRGYLDPADVVSLAVIPRVDLAREADVTQIHELVDTHQPDVLFIGPLYRLIPRAINSDDDAAPLLAALDTLRERGLAMVIEAHAGHAIGNRGERDLRPRGSAALLGWPEFGLGIRVDRDNEGLFKLVRWRGDRDQRNWPEYLRRGVNSWPWIPTQPTY